MLKYKLWIDPDELKTVLFEAKRNSYAAGSSAKKTKHQDGATEISYQKGDLFYRDKYYGGEPFSGDEMVFCGQQPVWRMNFTGRIEPSAVPVIESIYRFLMVSLSQNTDKDKPFRGPAEYAAGDFKYKMISSGDFDFFSGQEEIYYQGKIVYTCFFNGGLLDLLH